ncbi:hypothetical protein EAG11_08705 [Flavobacterium sp. 140616W15]|nr:hypothetical protein EAG11_08705 [Flavobacterium sp. 140616W15]
MSIQKIPLTKDEKVILKSRFRTHLFAIIFIVLPVCILLLFMIESLINQIQLSNYDFMFFFGSIFVILPSFFFIKYLVPFYMESYKSSKKADKWVIRTRVLNIKTSYQQNTIGVGYNKFKKLNAVHEFTTDHGFSINSDNVFIGNPKNNLNNSIMAIGSTIEIHCLDDNCTQILVFKKIG